MRHQSRNVDWRDPGVKVDMKVRPCDMSFKHGSRTVGKHEPFSRSSNPQGNQRASIPDSKGTA